MSPRFLAPTSRAAALAARLPTAAGNGLPGALLAPLYSAGDGWPSARRPRTPTR